MMAVKSHKGFARIMGIPRIDFVMARDPRSPLCGSLSRDARVKLVER